jgi:hypothetical protein
MDVSDRLNLKRVNVFFMIIKEIQFVILLLNVNQYAIILFKHNNYSHKEIYNKTNNYKIKAKLSIKKHFKINNCQINCKIIRRKINS